MINQPYAAFMPFNGLHPNNPFMTRLPTSEGWKAELAWFVDP